MQIKEFKLERYFAKYEFQAPYLLCASDCESITIKELLQLDTTATSNYLDLKLGYTESLGHPELRQSIANLYTGITANQILVFSGAEEAIFTFMNVVFKPGDHLIVQFPAYQSLYELARAQGLEVTFWSMQEEQHWDLDLEFLKQHLQPTTRAIILNNPHSPTGSLLSQKKFRQIIEIAEQHEITVFSDEVYRLLEFNPQDRLPALCELSQTGISLGVMSKAFGLPGLRIGWIATQNQEIYNKSASFKDYTTICASGPSEYLATIALQHKETILERNKQIINKNMKLLDTFFQKYAHLLAWNRPKAGSIAFPRILTNQHIDEFCKDLLDKKGVLLLPGTIFDYDTKYFRIGFGRQNMPVALEKFGEYLGF